MTAQAEELFSGKNGNEACWKRHSGLYSSSRYALIPDLSSYDHAFLLHIISSIFLCIRNPPFLS
jgi:hypothetical protein